ncbi:hypothetical protein VPNG_00376 [Cytospora leucostoma]|uniref:Uncharacterized protein n=1 Tax=Cytospora leucostoma TaxID=1230097 RepID=A0A423XN30_9PEZI|nr:hypothetical protein VPNG_00376 [Cytospora leucostoma]
MRFPSCILKRRALKKGKQPEKEARKPQPHEQARVTAPTPMGQMETERLLSGDTHAADDLKSLLSRAERVSRQVPMLNLNVRATEKWLQGRPDAIEDLLEEQQLAEMRARKAVSQQWLSFTLMRNSSLIGDSFKHSLRGYLLDDTLSSSTEMEVAGCCGHWQRRYCPDDEGCNAKGPWTLPSAPRPVVTTETEQPALVELDGENEDEILVEDHFLDEEAYRQSLYEVTAFVAKPAQARLIVIPTRTSSVSRKRGQGPERSSGTNPSEAVPAERWSTQARTGCRHSLKEAQGDERPDEYVPRRGPGSWRSIPLSLTVVPLLGLPAAALPPKPLTSWPLRSSWPLPSTGKETACGVV